MLEEKIIEVLRHYGGQQVYFAITFEKSGGTLPKQLVTLFESEFKQAIRKEKDKFINELEQMVLVWNNVVLMGKLTAFREQIEQEAKQ